MAAAITAKDVQFQYVDTIQVPNPNKGAKEKWITVFAPEALAPPSESNTQKEKAKGYLLIALGICVIVATVFLTLLCLGIPSSILSISVTNPHPFVYVAIGATAITFSLIGIYAIHKGTRYLKRIEKQNFLADDTALLLKHDPRFVEHTLNLDDKAKRILENPTRFDDKDREIFFNTLSYMQSKGMQEDKLKICSLIAKISYARTTRLQALKV